ncbi:DASH complex subunit dam1 [Ascosphaera acerosa]|nr:DASH complex subunit dam1 [Ascosphaera acerosa]
MSPASGHGHAQSSYSSRQRSLSRPTTPLRPSSRSSARSAGLGYGASTTPTPYGGDYAAPTAGAGSHAAILALEPQFAELADSIADLEANFMHLQLMHESLARFNENFASFLFGLNMNAFSVDFPEGPIPLSFEKARERQAAAGGTDGIAGLRLDAMRIDNDMDSTFLWVPTILDSHIRR